MQTLPKKKMPTKGKETPSRFTPLGIIATFLGVTEVAMGYPLTHTSGQVQLLLTYFATCFPLVVFAGFFTLSYFKPEALLAQPDFASAAEATEYLNALRGIVKKAETDATSIYASAEELRLLASQTKVSYEAVEDLRAQLRQQIETLQDEIKKSERRAVATAHMLS